MEASLIDLQRIRLSWQAKRERKWEAAILLFSEQLRVTPTNTVLLSGRGLCHVDLCQLDDALHDFNETIKYAPDKTKGYNNRGLVYLIQGKLNLALEDYKQCLTINPRDHICIDNMGKVLQEMGNLEESLLAHTESLFIKPDDTYTLCHRAMVHLYLGKRQNALQDLKDAAKTIQDKEGEFVVCRTEGSMCYTLGKYDEALVCFARALNDIESVRRAIDIKARRSLVHYKLGDINKAIEDIQCGLKYIPDHPRYLAMLSKYKDGYYSQDISKILTDCKESYANFGICCNGQQFAVHKALLEIRCPKLIKEPNTNLPIDTAAFYKVLEFIYTDRLPYIDFNNVLDFFVLVCRFGEEKDLNSNQITIDYGDIPVNWL